jgi:predicted dehydrogenase
MSGAGVLVVGLGRVGSRFDEEPGRRGVWSHVGAYLAVAPRLRLVGGVETADAPRQAFARRCPDVALYDNIAAACRATEFSVASICTPAEHHRAALEALLAKPGLRLIWCEKPIAVSTKDAQAMLTACRARDVKLVVSHVRRWHPLWQRAKALAMTLGPLRSIRVAMPNRLLTIGSHAVDLLVLFGGRPVEVRAVALPVLDEEGEGARALVVRFADGASGVFQPTGMKANLVVEAEVIGDGGRLRVCEQTGTIQVQRFADSAAYAGYRQLGAAEVEQLGNLVEHSPFLAVAEEITRLLADPSATPTCTGEDAMAVQDVLEQAA